MRRVVCSAPGKLILTGEHSVVYGEPALLAAIGLRTRAEIVSRRSSSVVLRSNEIGGERLESADSLTAFWRRASEAWSESKEIGTTRRLEAIRSDPYVVLLAAVGKVTSELKALDKGFGIIVDSQIPVGSGLGSSASVAAAVIAAMGRFLEKQLSLRKLNGMVYEVEKIMHGNPSGGDNTAVVYGGILQFRKVDGKFKFKKIKTANRFSQIYLVDSGKPVESTGEMVEWVNSKFQIPNSKCKTIMRKIGKLSWDFIKNFRKGVFRADLIQENQRLLEELGVVGERAQRVIREIESLGGAAKVCGAGGVKMGSGILLACHEEERKLARLLVRNGWNYYRVDLGVGGLEWKG